MTDFTCQTGDEGVAIITWNQPGTRLNLMTETGFAELDALVAQALDDPGVRGIVITSTKPDFAGGMDLNLLAGLGAGANAGGNAGNAKPDDTRAQALFDLLMRIHHILRRIERAGTDPKTLKGGKPVAWASPGTSAGIGTEIALACHRRFVADTQRARIGLPEIQVGLFPGSGGTTRMARMVGLMAAAPVLLEGRMLAPAAARATGLIDEVVPEGDLLARARAWVLAASADEIIKPWDRKGYKLPGGAPYHPAGFATWVGASAMVMGRTRGVYPAARAMLSALYEGALVPFDTALRIEARWFVHLLMQPGSDAMIRTLFLDKQALEKGARRPKDLPDATPRRIGVLGAGMMGAGIAHVAASAGMDVVLLDRDLASAEAGHARVAALLDDGVKRRKLTPEARDAVLARVAAGADHALLAGADLVIEAVFEDPALKAQVLASAGAQMGGGILASNTSSLPISDLARAAPDAARFVGIHFFSPVHKMALVEIIRGRETGPQALAVALDFVRAIGKTPIVVEDARFFYANRCIIPYVNEGIRMVAEGVAPALVENAARALGMPVGPLQLADETSIELAVSIARATRAALGDDYDDGADAVIFALHEAGRLGRKAGAGFYAYEGGKRTGLWPGLAAHWPPADPQPGLQEIMARLIYIQSLEAMRALQDGVLRDVREGNVGAVLGWGFAPWSGGPFAWADRLGAQTVLDRARQLASAHGQRFAPPQVLARLAETGGRFCGPMQAAG